MELNINGISLQTGSVYNRKQILGILESNDAHVRNGVFRPKGYNIVFLFVTEIKEKHQTQYSDRLIGEILEWDAQQKGHSDKLITDYKKLGLELLLFYRKHKKQYPGYGFKLLGPLTILRSLGSHPKHFWFRVVALSYSDYESSENNVYLEGDKFTISCNRYGRDPLAREEAIKNKGLTCEVCGFNFEEIYGERGIGYIEVHHIIPLSATGSKRLTKPEEDLAVLCSNCHRMIHRIRGDPILPSTLKEMLKLNGWHNS